MYFFCYIFKDGTIIRKKIFFYLILKFSIFFLKDVKLNIIIYKAIVFLYNQDKELICCREKIKNN